MTQQRKTNHHHHHRAFIFLWCMSSVHYVLMFACNLALRASAVSLVSFNRSTAAVPVVQTEVQSTGTVAVQRVTGTSDTAAVSLGSAIKQMNAGNRKSPGKKCIHQSRVLSYWGSL